jgi:L-amino acid N-acyltransferase YncA
MDIRIRPARPEDAAALAAVYAPHVLTGYGTFEEVPPDADEMGRRLRAVVAEGLPWLAAERRDDGRLLGYAYAGPFRTRPAYRVSVEDSIYLAPEACGQGLGRRLLAELIHLCIAGGRTTMAAVIGDSANTASIRLHESLGFTHAGVLKDMAFKHGRWLDVVFMQRSLGPKDA